MIAQFRWHIKVFPDSVKCCSVWNQTLQLTSFFKAPKSIIRVNNCHKQQNMSSLPYATTQMNRNYQYCEGRLVVLQ